ncbi:MAG TPA: hypothetical protein VMH30_12655 [Verrucomicrobiae bacterium]|nr:hypothetical protein [Verrucomicrobiae bacterium]
MNKDLSTFAARLRETIVGDDARSLTSNEFNDFALELFSLQFAHNAAYRKICEGRRRTPLIVKRWTQVPCVPTCAFKELELTSIASEERTAVFHSSGTTEQNPSRNFHNCESLELYEASLWAGFKRNILRDPEFQGENVRLISLTPPPEHVPHSSLVHMFETVRQKLGAPKTAFVGGFDAGGLWGLNFDAAIAALAGDSTPRLVLGTAFSFVQLLDFLDENKLLLQLPKHTRVMETGGYKNRSRSLPKVELHALVTEFLGVPAENIVCEYGMSELSSQAYDSVTENSRHPPYVTRRFHFPPWARAQIISPETGHEVADGEAGLIRIVDLANVFSVSAIQTEDLGIRRDEGFELIGRAKLSEPRGCSLMVAS